MHIPLKASFRQVLCFLAYKLRTEARHYKAMAPSCLRRSHIGALLRKVCKHCYWKRLPTQKATNQLPGNVRVVQEPKSLNPWSFISGSCIQPDQPVICAAMCDLLLA